MSRRAVCSLVLFTFGLVTLPALAREAPQTGPPIGRTLSGSARPPLIVLIVVDQFRADYVTLYGHQWTRGLRRLIENGASFPLASYPFSVTKTCPGHATIGTGTLPRTHGMIDNAWYDRADGRSRACTDDPSVTSVGLGGTTGTEAHSPHRMLAPTLAEELRVQSARPPNIFSISLKARSAIGMAGQPGPGTMVVWEEGNGQGTFATSSAYAAASAPWPEIDEWAATHRVQAAATGTWTKLLAEDAYLFDDRGVGEARDDSFPHAFAGPSGVIDEDAIGRWERSPWSDSYLAAMATAALTTRKLGQRDTTDLLAISFSALDLVGHAFGPRSHEVQDTLARLDATLGDLLAALDTQVGPDRYTVALTGDHGVPPIPEQARALGVAAGRLTSGAVRTAVESALDEALGDETWVANVTQPYLYLAPALLPRVLDSARARAAVDAALLGIDGVRRVLWAADIRTPRPGDESAERLQQSYVEGRSGDLAIVWAPYVVPQASGTTHGSPYAYDRAVPVVLFGHGIRAGRYLSADVSPADIAPTLAAVAGIQMARADGRILTEALTVAGDRDR